MKNKIKKYIASASFVLLSFGFFYPATQTLAENQEPVLIEIKDTDIGTEAFEKLKEFGIGGHATLGAILGSGQNMTTNPGVGLGIGSGGNGYRPTVTIAVWTNKPFDAVAGLQTIKQHLNVFADPVTTNGDCAIACDKTTQVEEEKVITTTTIASAITIAVTFITTTTTVAPTTTLLEVVASTQVSQSPQTTQPEPVQSQPQPIMYNAQPYTIPTTTTTTVVETVNVVSAFVNPVLTQKLISPISKPKLVKPKVIKSNKVRRLYYATVKKTK